MLQWSHRFSKQKGSKKMTPNPEAGPHPDPAAMAAEQQQATEQHPPTIDEVDQRVADFYKFYGTGRFPGGEMSPEAWRMGVEGRRSLVTQTASELGGLGVRSAITPEELVRIEEHTGLNFGDSVRVAAERDASKDHGSKAGMTLGWKK
jgi:hypothetical protein